MPSPREKLVEVFRSALELPAEITVETLQYQQSTWDSVAHLRLVSAIEAEFNVMYETDDILGMSSFEKAVETLKRLGVEV
jgi:acyl carrier protein